MGREATFPVMKIRMTELMEGAHYNMTGSIKKVKIYGE